MYSANLWECLEIAVYQLFSFIAGDIQTLCKSEDRDTINDAELARLAFCARHDSRHLPLFVNLCGCCGMDVIAFAERFNHVCVTAEMCHDAQLYLTIVC